MTGIIHIQMMNGAGNGYPYINMTIYNIHNKHNNNKQID
jgi:hypothetical protein